MKPLPDLDDVEAMALTGRRSVLNRARKEAAEALRDATTLVQSADIGAVAEPASKAIKAAQRLIEVATLWHQQSSSLEDALRASIEMVKARK